MDIKLLIEILKGEAIVYLGDRLDKLLNCNLLMWYRTSKFAMKEYYK